MYMPLFRRWRQGTDGCAIGSSWAGPASDMASRLLPVTVAHRRQQCTLDDGTGQGDLVAVHRERLGVLDGGRTGGGRTVDRDGLAAERILGRLAPPGDRGDAVDHHPGLGDPVAL